MIDEWLHAAMSDDRVVVELLLRLKQSDPQPGNLVEVSLPPLDWGLRQPRSKAAAALSSSSKEKEPTRRSPTTPLSWSGGGSGGASPSDGYEESSRPSGRLALAVRSKGTASNDSITNSSTSKRQRRKKTFAELKEEESSLLKERTHLKKELATLHITMKEQQLLNENLNRRKVQLHPESQTKSLSALNEAGMQRHGNSGCEIKVYSSLGPPPNILKQVAEKAFTDRQGSFLVQNSSSCQEDPGFVLPDLNTSPDEENGCGGLVEMS